jgi:ATP-dependent helicase HrpB
MIQSDPELTGIGAVIFDEFHERSLNADLGLALCLEIAGALREDLLLLAMSATLDAGPVAALMDAPLVTLRRPHVPGRDPLARPPPRARRAHGTRACRSRPSGRGRNHGRDPRLPSRRGRDPPHPRRSSRTVCRRITTSAPSSARWISPRSAPRSVPRPAGRKIVLATSIAETSLTIEDIRVVVDAGLARRARFDPGSGMARLVTERVTRAEAEQRRGRAGRVAEGTCYRLWTRGEEGALAAFPPAGIEAEDLAPLALDLALWGAEPAAMPFLTQPNPGAYAEAQALLHMLGALDAGGLITDHGRALAALPLHPRLAHMLQLGGPDAALLAALMAERDILPREAPRDLTLRVEAARDPPPASSATAGSRCTAPRWNA